MHSRLHSAQLATLALALSLALPAARAADKKPAPLDNLRFRFEVQRVEIEKPLAELGKKYDAQLAAHIGKSQNAGKLDEVLAAKAEREQLPGGGRHEAKNAPEFSRLQKLYEAAAEKLRARAAADLGTLLGSYLTRLTRLQREHTVTGDVEAAVKVRAEIDRAAKLLPETTPSLSNSPNGDRPPLPPNVVVYEGHSYMVVTEERTWKRAQERCAAMGGYLACIESSREMHFMTDFAARGARWIGGREESEGVWKWVNGSPFDYTSWLPGEPNNFGGIENSLTLGKKNKRGKWGDHAGNQKRYFICEWDWTPPAKEE